MSPSLSPPWNPQLILDSDRNRLEGKITEIILVRSHIAIDKLLSPPGKEECIQIFDIERFPFQNTEEEIDSETEVQEAEQPGTTLLYLKEQLKILALAKRIIYSRVGLENSPLRALIGAQASICLEVSASSRQTKMD